MVRLGNFQETKQVRSCLFKNGNVETVIRLETHLPYKKKIAKQNYWHTTAEIWLIKGKAQILMPGQLPVFHQPPMDKQRRQVLELTWLVCTM